MNIINNVTAARDEVINEVRKYMVGPLKEDEVLKDKPWEFYHTGILWPSGTELSQEEDSQNQDAANEEDGNHDGFLNMANCAQQSAAGFTFHTENCSQEVLVTASWAIYEGGKEDPEDEKSFPVWKRIPHKKTLSLALEKNCKSSQSNLYSDGEMKIRTVIRRRDETIIITLVMINEQPEDDKYEHLIYQSSLEVESVDESGKFISPPYSDVQVNDKEFWLYELIYRKTKLYSVGHGCSVDWEESSDGAVRKIRTEWIPQQEVLKASSDVLSESDFLNLRFLCERTDRDTVCNALAALPDEYEKWVDNQNKRVEDVVSTFPVRQADIRQAAVENIRICREQLTRMRKGLEILKSDDNAWEAFCLANESIAMSMEKKWDGDPRWRAFQLAFILISFPSTLYSENPDREKMDLIWFPTGGGKTEAYLGLSAMLMFYRRLTSATPGKDDGTAIITRYTLRLLTIQQFERAAAMICAANVVLSEHSEYRSFDPFSIGLFVGGGATPNNLKDAQALIKSKTDTDENCTTLPVKSCPWCGTDLDKENNQYVDSIENRIITRCPKGDCEFHSGLPILITDDEIYNKPPTIVIGTVDKFASMAWKSEVANIFGRGKPGRIPPDLIIQDELHLITNALGTVTALYETAIDYLCSRDNHPVKVVGSTATIRRAEDQTKKLFNRESVQFPPSALDADDSFFYKSEQEKAGRMYVGLHAQGRSPKYTLARLAGNCFQSNLNLPEEYKDDFYTLVFYFNSLRELGGALVLLEDDVKRYMATIPGLSEVRKIPQIEELTSQLKSHQIPAILKKLEHSYNSDDLNTEPVDAVLATNMISVGMDVDRLGMMIVNGQPKNTSEYIQASSRVGRPMSKAGLVFTLYNWTRPRDRSHYERFKAYHQAFYRHVESSAVTPFASRARDRALHGVLFSLVRQDIPEMADIMYAGRILDSALEARVRTLAEVIARRVSAVDDTEYEDTVSHLDDIIEDWKAAAESGNDPFYWSLTKKEKDRHNISPDMPLDHYCLMKYPQDPGGDFPMPTPNSMRDVEPSTTINLVLKRTH